MTTNARAPVPVTAVAPSPPVNYAPGAVAIVHAAPTDTRLLGEIPADSVGGFIFTGAPITLHDLSAQGVRYTGLTGVELQGWFKAVQAGRYEFGEDLHGWIGPIVGAPCSMQLWLEDRVVDSRQSVLPTGNRPTEQRTSLVVGADLQPGLYKFRLWTACIPNQRDAHITVDLLVKTPTDMNLRGFKPDELLHQGGPS